MIEHRRTPARPEGGSWPKESKKIQNVSRYWRLSFAASCLGIGLLLSAPAGCDDRPSTVAKAIPRVRVFVVGKQATGQSRRISGKVEAADRSPLSFGVKGTVIEVIVEPGQAVAEGQLLAQLDAEPLRLQLEEARAHLSTSRAQLVEAEATYRRTSKLFKQRGASQKEVDAATASLATSNGDLKAAQGALEQAELDLARTNMTAPFAGQIVQVLVDPFQEVTANDQAIVLQAAGALEIAVRVPETMIREVDFGQVVQATFPSLEGVTVKGLVTTIGADSESGNAFPVTVRLSASEADLRPGMTASVTFNFSAYLDGRTVYLIPLSAIAIDAGLLAPTKPSSEQGSAGNQAPVFVYDSAAGVVRLKRVAVGDLRGNEIEVYDGLQPGDQVVSAGVTFLRDGMKAAVWRRR
ncbi:MAG: efflux RND transporter periplasmic adaptor subunit [Planctomycetota bacterium]|nr:efflux RND transporter periplasmic adaptor subunit [Planctomycetota bacterium]